MTYREMVEKAAKRMYLYSQELDPKTYPDKWEDAIRDQRYYVTAMNAAEYFFNTSVNIWNEGMNGK